MGTSHNSMGQMPNNHHSEDILVGLDTFEVIVMWVVTFIIIILGTSVIHSQHT